MKIKSSIVVAAAAGATIAPSIPAMAQSPMPPGFSWTGFYAGAHVGYAWQQNETSGAYVDGTPLIPFTNNTKPSGFLGGGQIGYNWQVATWVFGFETDFSGMAGSGTATQYINPPFNVQMTSTNGISYLGTIRGRIGYTVTANWLAYITGGWAYGKVKNDHSEIFGGATATWRDHGWRSGYVFGGGFEYLINRTWSVRIEALHADLGSKTLGVQTSGVCDTRCEPVTFKNDITTVRLGVNMLFAPR